MHFTPVVKLLMPSHTQIVLATDWVEFGSHTHTHMAGQLGHMAHSDVGSYVIAFHLCLQIRGLFSVLLFIFLSVTIKYPHSLPSLAKYPYRWSGEPVATLERVFLHRTKINTIPLARIGLVQLDCRILTLEVVCDRSRSRP